MGHYRMYLLFPSWSPGITRRQKTRSVPEVWIHLASVICRERGRIEQLARPVLPIRELAKRET